MKWICQLWVVLLQNNSTGGHIYPHPRLAFHSTFSSKDCDLRIANGTVFAQYYSSVCSGYCSFQCKYGEQEITKSVVIYECIVPWKYNYFVHLKLPLIKQIGRSQFFVVVVVVACRWQWLLTCHSEYKGLVLPSFYLKGYLNGKVYCVLIKISKIHIVPWKEGAQFICFTWCHLKY